LRILIVSPLLPWPLNTGGNAALFSTMECLASDHEMTFVCSSPGEQETQKLAARLPKVRVRGIFQATVAGKPGLPRRILRRGLRKMLGLLDPALPQAELPDNPFYRLSQPLIEAVKEELDRGTDLCQAEFSQSLPLASWLPRELPKIFIHHQIHFVYANRFVETHRSRVYAKYLADSMRDHEIACLKQYNAVVTFSEEDRQALLPYLSPERVFNSPFPVPADVGFAKEIPEKFDGRFLFLASEVHDPNVDALKWLMEEIWPEIERQLPSARLQIIGQWSRATQETCTSGRITFTGFVEDLGAALRGGIMLVPVRIGSGIRVKILVAAAQGVPVVTTPVGVEGLELRDGREAMVRGEAGAFAQAAVQLAREPVVWRRLAEAARDAVLKNYSAEQVRKRRNEIYANVMADAGR
jgi:glycosyltransferase involved in cell wall biosynthesis